MEFYMLENLSGKKKENHEVYPQYQCDQILTISV